MTFRVTPQIFVAQTIQNAQRISTNLFKLQQQASTGLRVLKASDDPEATRTILAQKVKDDRFEADLTNIQTVRFKLDLSVSQLLEANNVFVRAK